MGACYSSSAKDQENTPKNKKPHSRKEPKNGLALKSNGTNDEGSHGTSSRTKDLEEGDKSENSQRNRENLKDEVNDDSNSSSGHKRSKAEVVNDKEIVDGPEIVNNENIDSVEGAVLNNEDTVDTSEIPSNTHVDSKTLVKAVEDITNGCASDNAQHSSLLSPKGNSSHACENNEVDIEKISLHDQELTLASTSNIPHCACCRLSSHDTVLDKSESTPVTPLRKKGGYLRQHSLNLENVNTNGHGSKRSSLELRGFDSTTSLELGSALESLQDVKTMEIDGKEVVVIEKDVYMQVMDELASLRQKLGLLTDIINEADILTSGTSRDRSSLAQE